MWKKIVKAAAFILIFVALFACASSVLTYSGDYASEQIIKGFYKEPSASLDAVYIGSSTAFTFWSSLVAWDSYGIAVYPFASAGQPFFAAEYMIREARKTQPDALYIVNINTIREKQAELLHKTLDYLKPSFNRLALARRIADYLDLSLKDSLDLYIPLYRFHDRWSEIHPQDLHNPPDGLKGTRDYVQFLNTSMDLTEILVHTDKRAALPEKVREAADSLLDYCEREHVRVLFVTVPRAEKSEELVEELNELNDVIRARGFDTLDLTDALDEMLLDPANDYYNKGHVNIHGSLKFTQFFSEYLIERYGLQDKRGDPLYSSWDAGYDKFETKLHRYTLDIERDLHHRTDALPQPEDLQNTVEGGKNVITWTATQGAQGYLVCRRAAKQAWELLCETVGTQCTDETADDGQTYDYTVVPFLEDGGERYYGSFCYYCEEGHNDIAGDDE